MKFELYPINTYNLKQLAAMYSVSRRVMAAMIREAGIIPPETKKFRRIYFPVDVKIIFEKFGAPSKEI